MVAMATAAAFPDEVWEYVFSFITEDSDRNSISLVCQSWNRLDRLSRCSIFVGNCYAISPRRVVQRFLGLRRVSIKGKPHFADFNLVPDDWGGGAFEWICALAESCPFLEEIQMKRMVVTDECLELIGRSFRNFRSLDLNSCEGFSSAGLTAIVTNCRYFSFSSFRVFGGFLVVVILKNLCLN